MYGFDEDTSRYNKYKPWNSPVYKGSIEIADEELEKIRTIKDVLEFLKSKNIN